MAQPSPELQRRYGLLAGQIPGEIRAAIDDDELRDRFAMAEGLLRDSQAAKSPAVRKALGERSARVLQARPRAQTEQIVVAKMAKAKRIGDPNQAAALERQAREELEMHPPAVRRRGADGRPVAKAAAKPEPAADALMILHDAVGNPAYAIRPDSKDLIKLMSPDRAAEVAKSLQSDIRPRAGR